MYKFPYFRVPLKGPYFLILVSFLVALSISFIAPIFPLYIKSLVKNESSVGYVVAIIAFLLFISNFAVSKYLDIYKKKTLLLSGLIGCLVTVGLLSIITELKYFLILEIFRAFFLVAVYMTIALFIKDYVSSEQMGRMEGMNFTFGNIAWLIGPLLGAFMATKYSMPTIFLLGTIFPFAAFILVLSKPLKKDGLEFNEHNDAFKNIKSYFKDKDLRIIFYSSMGLMMWWAIIYTFTPLFIKNTGMSIQVIGYVLFAVTIPLILLEIPIGKLADRTGFRKFFILGFILIGIAAILTYFVNPLFTLVLIVLASIGGAFIEPLREAYLFKKLNKSELHSKYPVFRTATDVGQIVGPIIFSTILLYSNFKVLYLVVGILMLVFSLLMFGLKDIKK